MSPAEDTTHGIRKIIYDTVEKYKDLQNILKENLMDWNIDVGTTSPWNNEDDMIL